MSGNLQITRKRHAHGFSLVDVMVGMVISLIGVIVIMQVFAVSESRKRTTTSGGDAQQNGAAALLSLERELGKAGYGMSTVANADLLQPNPPALFVGCTVNGYDTRLPQVNGTGNFSFTWAPVVITSGAATVPDSIAIASSSGSALMSPVKLAGPPNTKQSDCSTNGVFPSNYSCPASYYGFNTGDVIMFVENIAGMNNCLLRQVTTVVTPTSLGYAAGNTTVNGINYATVFNGNNAPPNFTGAALIYNLGVGPRLQVYSISNGQTLNGQTSNNQLISSPFQDGGVNPAAAIASPAALAIASPRPPAGPLTTPSASASTEVVADNIVMMKMQYGKATNPVQPGVINLWDNVTPPLNPANAAATAAASLAWSQIMAVRLVIVARSAQPEVASTGVKSAVCDTTTVQPTWAGTTVTANNPTAHPIDLSATAPAGDDWKCYRYKTFETTIPLRNMIWRPCDNVTNSLTC